MYSTYPIFAILLQIRSRRNKFWTWVGKISLLSYVVACQQALSVHDLFAWSNAHGKKLGVNSVNITVT